MQMTLVGLGKSPKPGLIGTKLSKNEVQRVCAVLRFKCGGCTHLNMFSSTLALELFLINACTGPREMAQLVEAQAEALCGDLRTVCGKCGRREVVF